MDTRFDDLRERIAKAVDEGATLDDLGIGIDRIVIDTDIPVQKEYSQESKGIPYGKIFKWTLILAGIAGVSYYLGRKSILGINKPVIDSIIASDVEETVI